MICMQLTQAAQYLCNLHGLLVVCTGDSRSSHLPSKVQSASGLQSILFDVILYSACSTAYFRAAGLLRGRLLRPKKQSKSAENCCLVASIARFRRVVKISYLMIPYLTKKKTRRFRRVL